MRRPRLTITLREDIIRLVDSIVDGKIIRNRSNAIEHIIENFFSQDVNTGVILTSGLSKIVKNTPRCLVQIKNKAIIEYTLNLYKTAGLNRIIICSDSTEEIKSYLDSKNLDHNIEYIKQPKNLGGTAKALKLVESKINNENFILIYGDVLVNINLLDFINFYKNSNAMCAVALTSVLNPREWGMIKMKGNEITEFQEKPQKSQSMSFLVNSGVFLMNHEIFKYLKSPKIASLECDVLTKLSKDNKLKGYVFDGLWFDTGQKEMYEKAQKQWNLK